MVIPPGYDKIIEKLESATAARRVNWQIAGGRAFVAFSNFSLSIWEYESAFEHEEGVMLSLMNDKGERVDSITVPKGDENYERVHSLCGQAFRSAKKIDATLEQLAKELDANGIIGTEPPPEITKKDIPF
jgi:hypothetical protein